MLKLKLGWHLESFVSACKIWKITFTDGGKSIVFAYLIDMQEEYRQVKEDDDKEGQNEDDSQRGEDPHQVLQNTQIVLHLTKAGPFLPRMEHTHL